jgi:hypothetical protein
MSLSPPTHANSSGIREWPHWLALALMAVFSTRKSHAARLVIRNSLILIDKIRVSDIFNSHHPLQSQPSLANASQLGLYPSIRQDVVGRWLALAVISHAASIGLNRSPPYTCCGLRNAV